jgi:manganese transport protein
VGAYAGAMIMQGLLHKRIPLVTRRLVTLVPAIVVLALGVDPSAALVVSQVVLSFGIPFALVPLIRLTADRDLMGPDANRRLTTVAASVIAAIIIALNLVLVYLTVTG